MKKYFLIFMIFSIVAPITTWAGKNKIRVRCLDFKNEKLCYPKDWKRTYPNVPNLLGRESFYYGEDIDFDAINCGVWATTDKNPSSKNWAKIEVENVNHFNSGKIDKKWLSSPIKEMINTLPCNKNPDYYPCYKFLRKGTKNKFNFYGYKLYGGPNQWLQTVYLYLVKGTQIYKFEFYAHKDEYENFEKYYSAVINKFIMENSKSKKID